MSIKNKKISYRDIVTFTAVVACVMLGNLNNVWHCMTPVQFAKRALAPTNNGFVLGRMAMNNQQGILAQSGLLTHIQPHVFPKDLPYEEAEVFQKHRWIYGYRAYVDDFEITYNQPYKTKTANNAHLYWLFGEVLPISRESNLQFVVWQKSFFFGCMVAFIVLLFSKLTNIFSGILIALAFIFNPYINLFGVALYWVPWTFFFPFAVAFYYLYRDYRGHITFGRRHYVLIMLAMFVHMFFHSFEFIPTVGIMSVTPFVLFGVLKKYPITKIIKHLAIATAFYLSAMLAGIALISAQQAHYFGSWAGAWEHFVFSFSARTNGKIKTNASKNPIAFKELQGSSKFPLSYTYNLYLEKEAMQIDKYGHWRHIIRFKHLILAGLISSIFLIFYHFRFQRKEKSSGNLALGLVIGCWFSALAPLFWFTMFRGHSNFHPHVNSIILYMPFMILLMGMIGYSITTFLNIIRYRPTLAN